MCNQMSIIRHVPHVFDQSTLRPAASHRSSHANTTGMLGTVRVSGAECRLIKDMRYMPDDGHLAAHKFL